MANSTYDDLPKLFTRKGLLLLSAAVAVGLTAIAWLAAWWYRDGFPGLFPQRQPLLQQILIGSFIASFVGTLMLFIQFKFEIFRGMRNLVKRIIRNVHLTPPEMFLIALCAGWGEEIFFRGVLHPELGNLLTSLLFTLAHGIGLSGKPKEVGFAAIIFLLSLGLGVIYEQFGLIASMTAHAWYDFVLIFGYYWYLSSER